MRNEEYKDHRQHRLYGHAPNPPTAASYVSAGVEEEGTRIGIADIVERRDWQARSGLHAPTIRAYATVLKNGGNMPPVKVADVGGTLVLVDGWHRLAALRAIGEEYVEAEILTVSEDDAQWLAARSNLDHGLPLKRKELLKAFKMYVGAGQHRKGRRRFKSYREMAADFMNRIAHTTIRNWMKRHFPAIAKKIATPREEQNGPYEGGSGQYLIPVTPLSRALQNLDAAHNEAKALSPKERGVLIAHISRIKSGVEKGGPWKPYTIEIDDNDDF